MAKKKHSSYYDCLIDTLDSKVDKKILYEYIYLFIQYKTCASMSHIYKDMLEHDSYEALHPNTGNLLVDSIAL